MGGVLTRYVSQSSSGVGLGSLYRLHEQAVRSAVDQLRIYGHPHVSGCGLQSVSRTQGYATELSKPV